VARCIHYKSTRTYNTWANLKKRMEVIDQENQGLREEVAALREGMEKLTVMVTTLLAVETQTSVPQPTSTALDQPITPAAPVSNVLTSTPQPITLRSYLWGMPNMYDEGVHPVVSEIPTPFTQ